jgi:hypothetical protein
MLPLFHECGICDLPTSLHELDWRSVLNVSFAGRKNSGECRRDLWRADV